MVERRRPVDADNWEEQDEKYWVEAKKNRNGSYGDYFYGKNAY